MRERGPVSIKRELEDLEGKERERIVSSLPEVIKQELLKGIDNPNATPHLKEGLKWRLEKSAGVYRLDPRVCSSRCDVRFLPSEQDPQQKIPVLDLKLSLPEKINPDSTITYHLSGAFGGTAEGARQGVETVIQKLVESGHNSDSIRQVLREGAERDIQSSVSHYKNLGTLPEIPEEDRKEYATWGQNYEALLQPSNFKKLV